MKPLPKGPFIGVLCALALLAVPFVHTLRLGTQRRALLIEGFLGSSRHIPQGAKYGEVAYLGPYHGKMLQLGIGPISLQMSTIIHDDVTTEH
jgi:hypothetical protein